MRFDRLLAVVLMAGSVASGQTRIDLFSQGKSVDFSTAAMTKPTKTGVTLPAICSTGEMYFKNDASPGQNLYLCASSNAWTQLTGSGSSSPVWGAIAGTLSSQTDLQSVLDAKAAAAHAHTASDVTSGTFSTARLGSGTASSGTFLRGDGTWATVSGVVGSVAWGAITGTLSSQTDLQSALNAKAASSHAHSGADVTSGTIAPARLGSGTPSSSTYLRGDGTWAAVSGGGAANPAGTSGQIQINDGGVFGARPVGNGLLLDSVSISVDPTTVTTIAGAQTVTGNKTYSGVLQVSGNGAVLDASLAKRTKPERVVAASPSGACEDGEINIKNNGQRYVCVGGTWASGTVLNQTDTEPTCNATNSGLLYLSTSTTPNVLRLCGKNSSGSYAWATVPVNGWLP